MRRHVAAGLAVFLLLPACEVNQGTIGQGSVAPAFDAVTFDGRPVSFPELLDGKPAVVVFWATWCSYCKAFMPYLEDIEAAYGDRINVLTINAKEDGSGEPAAYVGDLNFPMIAISEGDAIAAAYDVEYIPGLMIVDATGTVAYRRAWTDLPAGDQVARLWSIQVRQGLDQLLD
jgi:thiol-disulfide isomerase/thioredoxin